MLNTCNIACNIYQVFFKLCAGVNLEYLLIILVPNNVQTNPNHFSKL